MFDIFVEMFKQLITFIPGIFGIYLIFDLLGGLLFNKR